MFTEIPKIEMYFNEKEIPIKLFVEFEPKGSKQNYCENRFGDIILDLNKSANTITSGIRFWKDENLILTKKSYNLIGSFPLDYKFNTDNVYIIGMSVPPIMTAQIATKIYNQWLSKIK